MEEILFRELRSFSITVSISRSARLCLLMAKADFSTRLPKPSVHSDVIILHLEITISISDMTFSLSM